MKTPSKEQIQEWAENPVTEFLLVIIENYVEDLRQSKGVDAFHPFEPQRTQEILAGLNGAIDSWEDIIEVFTGDWSILDESDSTDEAEESE